MAQVRKTRQQKIQQGLRMRERQEKVGEVVIESSSPAALPTESQNKATNDLEATQQYVREELRRIGWISLVCFGLLAVATLLLSDFAWVVSLRELLHLPHLFS